MNKLQFDGAYDMNDNCSHLNNYPLEEHYILCEQYLQTRIDWNEISEEIKRNGVSYFDISDAIRLFSHLELDENYKLICYLACEYHGIWGRIAAIRKGDDSEPVFDSETEQASILFLGKDFKLPENASPPMEALYHDGTDEGFLEAVLCTLLLDAIPYLQFENRRMQIIMNYPPLDIAENWNTIVNIEDWTPRRVNNSIFAFERNIEDGFGSSDGKDKIYLTQFDFQRNLGLYHAFKNKNSSSMYRNQIDDDRRYNQNRHCCVFTKSSVLIAKEI